MDDVDYKISGLRADLMYEIDCLRRDLRDLDAVVDDLARKLSQVKTTLDFLQRPSDERW